MRWNSMGRLSLMALIALLVLSLSGSVLASKLRIDRVISEDWEDKGTITFYVDILDDGDEVEEGLDTDTLKVFIEDEEVPGTFEAKTFEEAEQSFSLGIIITAHNQYMPQSEETVLGPDGNPKTVAISKEPFVSQKRGYAALIKDLGPSDRVAVWVLTNGGLDTVSKFNQNYKRTSQSTLDQDTAFDSSAGSEMPDLVKWLGKAVKSYAKDSDGHIRKILMIVSDGGTKDYEKRSKDKVEEKFQDVANKAVEAKVKIYTIGYAVDDEQYLGIFEGLSSLTGGMSRRIKRLKDVKRSDGTVLSAAMNPADMEAITDTIEGLGKELKKQYVIVFTPEDYDGAEEAVTIRLEAMAPQSKTTVKGKYQDVELKSVPFDWVMLIVWILVIIGSILLIFLIVKLIIRARKRKPAEVYYEEDDGPTGPYKGKLTVQGGDMIGAEFYLTEDVTTIGSLEGNNVVLDTAGVSKRHAGIKIEDMRFELADFGSTNGTLVNGVKITKQFLRDQDTIQIGDCEIKFSLK